MSHSDGQRIICAHGSPCEWIDRICDELENAWNSGKPPRLENFLDQCPRPAGGAPCRELVLELAMIDMERRWRGNVRNGRLPGDRPRLEQPDEAEEPHEVRLPLLEDYLRWLPGLGGPDQLPEEAIFFEYRLRWACGQRPEISEYTRRFPGKAEQLRWLLGIATEPLAGGSTTITWFVEKPSAHLLPYRKLGAYWLLERVGEGGMGEVYKALHLETHSVVAVKVLAQGLLERQRALKRFRREIQIAGRVEHPNVVRALEAGELGGTHFLVTEYVDGWDLEKLVRLCHPLDLGEASELVRQAARGLACIHEHGLVHRDVKPSNVMLSRQGLVKILDLGLALFRGDASWQQEAPLTGSDEVLGTFEYIAPEQLSSSHNVDHRADIYSLGCTFYQLLTGRPPFPRSQYRYPLEVAMAHRSQPIPPIRRLRSGVPDGLVVVLERMLAKDPQDRFSSANEVIHALRPWADRCGMPLLSARAAKAAIAKPVSADAR